MTRRRRRRRNPKLGGSRRRGNTFTSWIFGRRRIWKHSGKKGWWLN